MRSFLRPNGLSIALLSIFLLLWVGQGIVGWISYDDELRENGHGTVGFVQYLATGHFWEATAENWESEFLQMGAFVILTVFLYQKGSAESRDPDAGPSELDEDPAKHRHDPQAPWPVRRGGAIAWVYSHSLSLAMFSLFLISFVIHMLAGAAEQRAEEIRQNHTPASFSAYIMSAKFWFQSLQNWQSEFLAIASMVIFTIFLREKGSPESKPVHKPHHENAE